MTNSRVPGSCNRSPRRVAAAVGALGAPFCVAQAHRPSDHPTPPSVASPLFATVGCAWQTKSFICHASGRGQSRRRHDSASNGVPTSTLSSSNNLVCQRGSADRASAARPPANAPALPAGQGELGEAGDASRHTARPPGRMNVGTLDVLNLWPTLRGPMISSPPARPHSRTAHHAPVDIDLPRLRPSRRRDLKEGAPDASPS